MKADCDVNRIESLYKRIKCIGPQGNPPRKIVVAVQLACLITSVDEIASCTEASLSLSLLLTRTHSAYSCCSAPITPSPCIES